MTDEVKIVFSDKKLTKKEKARLTKAVQKTAAASLPIIAIMVVGMVIVILIKRFVKNIS